MKAREGETEREREQKEIEGEKESRPRMEKSHVKRHELSFGGLVSIVIVLTTPQK